MKANNFKILLFIFLCFIGSETELLAQKDSVKSDMSFDFGFTRGRNINVWPIIKINKTKEKKEIQILFSIFSQQADFVNHTKHSHLIPFYLNDSSATKRDFKFLSFYYPSVFRYTNDKIADTRSYKFLELAPEINLLEFTRSSDGLFVQNNFLFLLWYQNNKKFNKSHLILFPAYWSFKSEKRSSNTLFPFYTFGTYDNGKASFLGVTPLFWHFKKSDKIRNTIFPIWWYKKTGVGENAKFRNYIFPLFWSYRDFNSNRQTLFPIFWYRNNPQKFILAVLPAFYYSKEKNGPRRRLMLSPLFWHNIKSDGYSNVLFPLWWNKKSGSGEYEKSHNVIFPFWWSFKNHEINNKIFFPFIWSFQNHFYNSFTFIPFFSIGQSNDNSSNHSIITPFFWHIKTNNGYTNLLFPIWYNNKKGAGEYEIRNNIIFPIYWSHRDYEKNNKIIFPFIWYLKNKNYKSLTFAPVFSFGHSVDTTKNHLVITPFFWHIKNKNDITNILFPLWWNSKKGIGENEIYNNIVFPLYWSHRDIEKNNKILAPFLWSLKNKNYQSFTFAPIFSVGHSIDSTKKHFVVAPFFWHLKNKDKNTNILFPLWWSKNEGIGENYRFTNVFLPLYWAKGDQNKKTNVLFPVLWNFKTINYKSFTFAPFFSCGTSPDSSKNHLIITPLFWHVEKNNEKYNILFPFWWNRKQGTGDSTRYTNMVFPLFWSYHDNEKRKFALFPIMWSRNDKYYKSFTLLPIISKGHSPDNSRSHFMATPFFWQIKKNDEITNVLFPLWWYKKQGTGNNQRILNHVIPLYFSSKEKEKKYNILIPFLWNFKDKFYHSFTVAPLLSFGNSPDSTNSHLIITPLFWHFKKHDKIINTFFPIWWNKKEGIGENAINTNVVFPLYFSQKSKEKNNKVLFPVIWDLKDKNYHSFTIPPIFSHGISPDTLESHLMITPVFWKFKNKDQYTNVLFPLWWHKSNGIGENMSSTDVFFPLYWAKKNKYEHNRILFPLVWSLKNQKYESFTIFPVLSRGNSPDSTRSHWMLSPIFWHFQNFDDRLNVAFPIWWSKKEVISDDKRYTDVIFPFYWSFQNKEKNNKVLFPLIWSFKNPDYTSLTIPPIFSTGSSSDSTHRHLMITPFFWHTKNHSKISNVLFPLWWNQRKTIGDDVKIRNYVFPFYWSKRSNRSNTHILFPILWQHKSKFKTSFTLFPIFSYGNSNNINKNHLVITPLFWNIQKPASRITTLIPFFYYKSDTFNNSKFNFLFFLFRSQTEQQKKSISFIWPICEFSRDTNFKYFRFAPVIWYQNSPEKKYFSIMPFYYYSKSKEMERSYILWQLFVAKNYFNIKKTRAILWKFITWEQYENHDKEFRIMHLLYANVKKDGGTEKSIFPFYYRTTEKNGNKSLSVFLGFYNSFKRKIQDTEEFYQEQRIFWVIRLRSNFKNLKERGLIQSPKQLK